MKGNHEHANPVLDHSVYLEMHAVDIVAIEPSIYVRLLNITS